MANKFVVARNRQKVTNNLVSKREFGGVMHTVVSGVGHIVSDSVMNGLYYPKDVVESLAKSLSGENVFINAPLGHPEYEGSYVSASHPIAIQLNGIGAFCFNFRIERDSGRLISDLAINEAVACKTEGGAEVVRRIHNGEDCDMSTGLWCVTESANAGAIGVDGEPYSDTVTYMSLDHTALLPNEPGAATSNEGVGLYANAATNTRGEQVDVIVSDVDSVMSLKTNSIAAAMSLPVSAYDAEWDSSAADKRIRELTGSKDKPSANYRKYFLYFDRSKVDDFASYKLPFADVINGKPHAVVKALVSAKAALSGARGGVDIPEQSKAEAEKAIDSYMSRVKKQPSLNKLSSWLKGILSYNAEEPNKTSPGDDPMKEKIIAALTAKGINVEGMEDDDLMEAYARLMAGKTSEPEKKPEGTEMNSNGTVDAAALMEQLKALGSEITAMKASMKTNEDEERKAITEVVVGLDIGIDEDTAKSMSVNSLKSIAAKNGHINANAGAFGGYRTNSSAALDTKMPD